MAALPNPDTVLGPRPTPQPDLSVAPIDSTPIVRAVGGIGDALFQIDDELTKARRTSQLNDAISKATEDLGNKEIELAKDQDFKTASKRFREYATEVGAKYSETIGDGIARQAFSQDFQRLAVTKQLGVVRQAQAQEADFNKATLQESTDMYARQAVAASISGNTAQRDLLIKQAHDGINRMAGKFGGPGWISDVEAKSMQDRFLIGYYDFWRTAEPDKALEDFQQGKASGSIRQDLAMRLEQHLFQAASPVLANQLKNKVSFDVGQSLIPGSTIAAPNLIGAMIASESGGRIGLTSPAGAMGIMQVMPATAKEVAGKMGLAYDEGKLLNDAGYNRAIGTQYMNDMLAKYGGNTTLALAAYNAGPGAVDGWIARYGDPRNNPNFTDADFVGSIPYDETRDYVMKTMKAADGAAGPVMAHVTTRISGMDPREKTGIPVIDNLPADQKLHVMQLAQAMSNRENQGLKQDLTSRLANAKAEALSNGTMTNAPTDAEIMLVEGPLKGPMMIREKQDALQLGQNLKSMQTLPNDQIIAMVDKSTPMPGSPDYLGLARNHELLTTAAQSIVKARSTDPVAYALSTQSYGLAPLDFSKPQDIPAQMQARSRALPQMQNDYNTAGKLFTASEASALTNMLQQQPVQVQKMMLGQIYKGLEDGKGFNYGAGMMGKAMEQIAKNAPAIALAGVYQGQMYPQARNTADVPGLLLRGQHIIDPRGEKNLEGGKSIFPLPKEATLINEFNSVVGKAFAGHERAIELYYPAAKAIYAAMSSDAGAIAGDADYDSDRWRTAIKYATGGIEKYQGASTQMPYQWSLSQFKDSMAAKIDALPDASLPKGLTREDIKDAPVQSNGDGVYLVRSGSGWAVDPSTNRALEIRLYTGGTPEPTPMVVKKTQGDLEATRRGHLTMSPFLGQ